MKKLISSALVIVLTFITVIVMVSLKTNYTFDSINITDDIPNSQERPDGTGLIFEDYDKNINIPVNNQNSTPEKSTKDTKEDKGDKVNYNNYNDYKRLYEDYIAFNLPIPESERGDGITSSYSNSQKNSSSNNNAESIENKVSLSDKIYIAKIATNLNLQEISTIRKTINDAPNDWELRKIWNTLKDKLPEEDYEKLVEIVEKYER